MLTRDEKGRFASCDCLYQEWDPGDFGPGPQHMMTCPMWRVEVNL